MKHRKTFAVLAACLMLTAAGCGQKNEEAFTNEAVQAPAGADYAEEAADAADADFGGAADDALAGAPEGEISYSAKGDSPDSITAGSPMADAAGEADGFADVESFKSAAAKMEADGIRDADAPVMEIAPEPIPDEMPADHTDQIGVLTAGEWRDHDNWGFFSNLVNSDIIRFPSYGLDPTQRIAVTVTDEAGTPAPNTRVQLLDDENTPIWAATTGKDGIAYLFAENGKNAQAVTIDGMEAVTLPPIEGEQQGNVPKCSDRAVSLTIAEIPAMLPNTQIMFIVDTTGSMGDEMLYLQSDFSAIAEEIGDENTEYAALFYKDEGDGYVTKYDGFTPDVADIKARLNAEFADGGGDLPEAVAEALTEGLGNEDWRDDAVKIAFLIFDAPPHDGREAELQTAIAEAAEKGIHLIPVVSSNGDRETELFGRAAAILTNGSYVFLTDDSGVGESHLEPIIGDYEVEKLHDIIVRIVQNYKQ